MRLPFLRIYCICIKILDNDFAMVSKKNLMYCLSRCLNKNKSFVVSNQDYVLTDLEYKKLEKLIINLRSGKPLSGRVNPSMSRVFMSQSNHNPDIAKIMISMHSRTRQVSTVQTVFEMYHV